MGGGAWEGEGGECAEGEAGEEFQELEAGASGWVGEEGEGGEDEGGFGPAVVAGAGEEAEGDRGG